MYLKTLKPNNATNCGFLVSITPPTDIAIIGMPEYPGAPPKVRFDNILEKFRLAETSDLQVEIQKGDNEFNFCRRASKKNVTAAINFGSSD